MLANAAVCSRIFILLIASAEGITLGYSRVACCRIERVVAEERVLEKLDYPPDGNHDKEDKESPKKERFLFFSPLLASEMRDVDRHSPKVNDEREDDERDGCRVDNLNNVESKLLERLCSGFRRSRRKEEHKRERKNGLCAAHYCVHAMHTNSARQLGNGPGNQ